MLIAPFARAQSFYNNGSIMLIGQGVDFSVKDSLVNKGTLTNNGNMVMGGVWLNQGTYLPGTGEITFNSVTGSDAQIINHNSQSFGKLTISGGGEKIILADMTIEGELVLIDGVIAQQNNSQVVFQSTAILTGGSDQSHINAPVSQQGGGQKTFPLGNGTTYLPVSINNISNTGTTVKIEAIEGAQSLQPGFDLASIIPDRYWKVETLSGDLNGTTISLPLKTSQVFGNTTSLVVAQSDDIGNDFRSIGQSNFTGNENNGVLTSAQSPTLALLAIGVASVEAGGIVVFNAVSPNGDAMNDYFMIGNIDLFPSNVVKIFNRWGDKVYEQKGYNNTDKFFTGKNNVGGSQELPSGVYFYSINKGDGSEEITGYLSLKR
jgi:gliding motility-associated-like protein